MARFSACQTPTLSDDPRHASGRAAEALAREHLQDHGLRLIEQNWRGKRGELDLAYAVPTATADVVLSARDTARGRRLADIVGGERTGALLRDNGWRVTGLESVPGVASTPQLPAHDGLPSAGVLQALRDLTK